VFPGVRGDWPGLIAVTLAAWLFVPGAYACPYSVRQVGFVILKKEPYRVCCLVRDDTPDRERVASWFRDCDYVLMDSNVEAAVLNLDQSADEALASAVPRKIDRLPAVVIVSPSGERTMRLRLGSQSSSEDAVRALLERAVSSPKREELKSHIVKNWCVVMLATGGDRAKNEKARGEVKAALEEVAGSETELGATIDVPPHLLVVASDDPAEKVLLWSLGLPHGKTPEPRVVVLFGRGQQIGPVLEGRTLTRAWVRSTIYKVGMNCACMTDHRWVSGPRIPLRWEEDCQEEVRRLVGIDPDSPEVRLAIARAWQTDVQMERGALGLLGYTEGPFVQVEAPDGSVSVEATPEPIAAARLAVTRARSATEADPGATLEERAGKAVIAVIAGMVVVVLACSGVLLWRKQRA